jgi:hypothetical protein
MGNYDTSINLGSDTTEIATVNKSMQAFVRKKLASNPEYFASIDDQGDELKIVLNDAKYNLHQFMLDFTYDED